MFCSVSVIVRGLSRSRTGVTKLSSLKNHYKFPSFQCFSYQMNMSSTTLNASVPSTTDFFFRQLFDNVSSTYSYLLADLNNGEALIIDPVLELAERDAELVKQLNFNLKYAINTHVHADHITGTGKLKKIFPNCKSVISEASGAVADVKTKPFENIEFGRHRLEIRPTPGHTNGCVTYVCHEQGMAFTGDALLIRGCGRTDFQEGSSDTLYKSVHSQIFTLPPNFRLYPAHDYKGQTTTTVAEEKLYNPRLSKPLEEFKQIMDNLNLSYPKMIDKAVPANKVCGLHDL